MNELKQFGLQMAQVWSGVAFVVFTVAFVALPVQIGPISTAERPAAIHLT